MEKTKRQNMLDAIKAQSAGLCDYYYDSKGQYLRCSAINGYELSIGIDDKSATIRFVLTGKEPEEAEKIRKELSQLFEQAGVTEHVEVLPAGSRSTLLVRRHIQWDQDNAQKQVLPWILTRWIIYDQEFRACISTGEN